MTKELRPLLTEHIELPDPAKYRKMHVVHDRADRGPGALWLVRAGPSMSMYIRHRARRLTVFQTDDRELADSVRDEMQIRLSVARALLDLEV